MAALARRTWAQLKTEFILRMGGVDYSTFASRSEYWINDGYLKLATSYQHPELEILDTTTLTLTSGTNEVATPSNLYVAFLTRLLDAAGTTYQPTCRWMEAHTLAQEYNATAAVPTRWTRYGEKLYFNTKPATNLRIHLWYYKEPAPPDFASGNSPLAWAWDQAILDQAIVLAFASCWRPDLAATEQARLNEFLGQQPYPMLQEGRLVSLEDVDRKRAPHGGATG